jgi:hypothetical protein
MRRMSASSYVVAWAPRVEKWEVYRERAEPRFPQRFDNREDAVARAEEMARLADEPTILIHDQQGGVQTVPVGEPSS